MSKRQPPHFQKKKKHIKQNKACKCTIGHVRSHRHPKRIRNTRILLNLLTTPPADKTPFLSIAALVPLRQPSTTTHSILKPPAMSHPKQGRTEGLIGRGHPPRSPPLARLTFQTARWHFNLFPTAAIRRFCFHLLRLYSAFLCSCVLWYFYIVGFFRILFVFCKIKCYVTKYYNKMI